MLSTFRNRAGNLFSDPFEAIRRDFERELGFVGSGVGARGSEYQYGAMSLWEDEGHFYIELDVPGLSLEDLEVTHERGQIRVRGERKIPQHGQQAWYDERSYGTFERIIRLSDAVEAASVEASLHDGVLCLTLAKKPEYQAHRVVVKGSGQKRLETA